MTICYDDVKAIGEQAAIDTMEEQDSIELCVWDSQQDIKNKLSDLVEDSSRRWECYSVDYVHEAWDIVNDSELNPDDDCLDFSGCQDARDCVLLEARASVQGAIDEGWDSQLDDYAEALCDLVDTVRERMGYTGSHITINIGRGSQFGWAVHNYETEYCCVWDDEPNEYHAAKLEGELYAIETTVDGTCFYVCWNPDND